MAHDALSATPHLLGFITELDFDQAEEEFPGIGSFYEHCGRKPNTFLELVWQFEDALAAATRDARHRGVHGSRM